MEKAHIAALLVYNIRSLEPSGRFLKQDGDGSWWDIGDQKAIKKVGQAMREFSRVVPRVEDESPKQVLEPGYCRVLHRPTTARENHDAATTSQRHGFSTEVATTVSAPYESTLSHTDHASTMVDAMQPVEPGYRRVALPKSTPRENHDSTATNERHGFSTEMATAHDKPVVQHLDHPPTVVAALQEFYRGHTPPSPDQITNQHHVPLSKQDSLGQVTHSAYHAIDEAALRQCAPSASHKDRPVVRHPRLAPKRPQHFDNISVRMEVEKPVGSPTSKVPVAEELFDRTVFPTRASLSTIYPGFDRPDKERLLQEALSATLDASEEETKHPAAPAVSSAPVFAGIEQDDRAAAQPTSLQSTGLVASPPPVDSVPQQALSRTLSGDDHDQLKTKIRESQVIFGRPLHPTAAGLSAIGGLVVNNDGATGNHKAREAPEEGASKSNKRKLADH